MATYSNVAQAVAADGWQPPRGLLAAGKHHQQILAQTTEFGGDKIAGALTQGGHDQDRGDAQADG